MGTDVATRKTSAEIAEIMSKVDLSEWANSVVNGTAYREPDPEYIQRKLMMQVLTAETADVVLAESQISKLQELVPDIPGLSTGNIEITEIYVTGSDFGDGMPCYVIVEYISMDSGEAGRFTTGAGYVQAQMLALLKLGQWPIRCKIVRLTRKDRGGKHLFQMFPAD